MPPDPRHPSQFSKEFEVPQTETRQHQWMEMKVTPVTIMDIDGTPIPMATPGKESQIQVGCFSCNMGLDEGFEISCPGEDLFREHGE